MTGNAIQEPEVSVEPIEPCYIGNMAVFYAKGVQTFINQTAFYQKDFDLGELVFIDKLLQVFRPDCLRKIIGLPREEFIRLMERYSQDQYDVAFISPAFWASVTKLMSKLRNFQYFRFFVNEYGFSDEMAEKYANRAGELTESLSKTFTGID